MNISWLQNLNYSFRDLALEFNPEKLLEENAVRVFVLICEAYDVLSDSLHRAVFDQYGEEGLKKGVPGPDGFIEPYHYHGDPMRTYKYVHTAINVLKIKFCKIYR